MRSGNKKLAACLFLAFVLHFAAASAETGPREAEERNAADVTITDTAVTKTVSVHSDASATGSGERETEKEDKGEGARETEWETAEKAGEEDRDAELREQRGKDGPDREEDAWVQDGEEVTLEISERGEGAEATTVFWKGAPESEEYRQNYDEYYTRTSGIRTTPSYEGYSKEYMIYGRIFALLSDEFHPREVKQYCDDPERMADAVLASLKEKVGELQAVCDESESFEKNCEERAQRGCGQIGQPLVREGAGEREKLEALAFSCPVNRDAIVAACRSRSSDYLKKDLASAEERCARRFARDESKAAEDCQRFKSNVLCNRGDFIGQCVKGFGVKKEDFEHKCAPFPPPKYTMPDCKEGHMRKKVDSYGCVTAYYCEEDIQESCSKAYEPVCGTEGITYINGCTAERAGVRVSYKGECKPKGDNLSCAEVYSPVCGSDGITYPNACKARAAGTGAVYEGECKRTVICPLMPVTACPEGQKSVAEYNSDGCIMKYACERTEPACPAAPEQPACGERATLTKKLDEKGCVTGYECVAVAPSCPPAPEPLECLSGTLAPSYDSAGCLTGYTCTPSAETGSTSSSAGEQSASGTFSPITGRTVLVISDTGQSELRTYEDFTRLCEKNWIEQEKVCRNVPDSCETASLRESCVKQLRVSNEDQFRKVEYRCLDTVAEIKTAEKRCARSEEDKSHCLEKAQESCQRMRGLASECREALTEEKLRNFIVREAKKRCKFQGILPEESEGAGQEAEVVFAVLSTATRADMAKVEELVTSPELQLELKDTNVYKGAIDPERLGELKLLPFVTNAKLLSPRSSAASRTAKTGLAAGSGIQGVAASLAAIRETDVPEEYVYVIEDKASEVLEASETLDEVSEQESKKGTAYKIQRFLGLARKTEQEEIGKLNESLRRLKLSAETLAKLQEEVPDDVAKAVLNEQVGLLTEQHAELESLIREKEKNSRGLFGIFG